MAGKEHFDDDQYADLGAIGEHPPDGTPGEIGIDVPGLHTQEGLDEVVSRQRVQDAIHRLHESGRTIAADWTPGRVTLWVSKHKRTIETSAAASAILATGATIYLLRKRAKGKGGS